MKYRLDEIVSGVITVTNTLIDRASAECRNKQFETERDTPGGSRSVATVTTLRIKTREREREPHSESLELVRHMVSYPVTNSIKRLAHGRDLVTSAVTGCVLKHTRGKTIQIVRGKF